MENQTMEIQTLENNLFKDMPEAPTPPWDCQDTSLNCKEKIEDLHLVQDGTKMSFCYGFKIKIPRNL